MNNYLITGFGGSGSMFLANVLNRSKYITAAHEDTPENIRNDVGAVKEWYQFNKQHNENIYIDVDTHMREYLLHDIGIDKILILRNWQEILMSWYAHRKELSNEWFKKIERAIPIFTQWIESGGRVIYFDQFTSDKNYLQNLVYQLGGRDMQVTEAMINNKMNSHNQNRITNYNQVPGGYRIQLENILGDFNDKYIINR